jgi:hypothetical protein
VYYLKKEKKFRIRFFCTEHNHDIDHSDVIDTNENVRVEMKQLISRNNIIDNEQQIKENIQNCIATTSFKKMKDAIQTIYFPNKCWSSEALESVASIYRSFQYAHKKNSSTDAADIINTLQNNGKCFNFEWYTKLNEDKEIDCVYWFSAIQKVYYIKIITIIVIIHLIIIFHRQMQLSMGIVLLWTLLLIN